MSEVKNILIPYIATGKYAKRYDTFIKSMYSNFLVDHRKIIVNISDQILDVEDKYIFNVIVDHLPWPIIALMKFYYINKAIDIVAPVDKIDYVFYFNSNTKFVDEIPESVFLTDKIVTVHNVGWDFLGHDPLKFTYNKPLDQKSATYIEGWYDYCQSCLFGGPFELMVQLCKECHDMLTYDLAHNRIPVFHDETAFNKWVHTHKDLVTILDGDWCAAEDHPEWGHPNAHIVLTNSDDTQYGYKDKYHE